MKNYTITRVTGTPDWCTIPALQVDTYQWLPKLPVTMQAQLCYTDSGIHLHLTAQEQNIRAAHSAPLSMVCEDSCMEFFVRPEADDLRYFNFEFNPNGCAFIGFGPNGRELVRLVPQAEDTLLQKQVRYTADGWELFFTVPVSLIRVFFPGYTLTPGKVLRANCYKCGDHTVQPHYIAWNPIDSETPNFHRPQDFGRMVLG